MDLLQKQQIHYFFKVVVALAPGLLILWLIRESVMLLHITSNRYLYKRYNQLFDMAYAENFIMVSYMTTNMFGSCFIDEVPFSHEQVDLTVLLTSSQSRALMIPNQCIKKLY